MTRHIFVAMVLLGMLLAAAGCGPSNWVTYKPTPADELRSLRPFKNPHLTERQKNILIKEVMNKAWGTYKAQREKETAIACVNPGRWEIQKPDESSQSRMRMAAAKGGASYSSDADLQIERTFAYIQRTYTEVNKHFGRFNDIVALLEAQPGDEAIQSATLAQGMLVMYKIKSLFDILGDARDSKGDKCSFEPLRYYLNTLKSVRDEIANVRLEPLLNDIVKSGVPESEIVHHRIQMAILKGGSARQYCSDISKNPSQYETNPQLALTLAWCGFDAARRGSHSTARAFWQKAKITVGNPEASSYASKALMKELEK